jgi:hypothetical protein
VHHEGTGNYSSALAHYRAAANAVPPGRLARNARNRILWIEERSEGGFAPLTALAGVRHDPSVLDDPDASARLAAEVESFPPGLVRSEMRLRIAEAWLRQPAQRADALSELRRVISDPHAGATDAVLAERDLVGALLAAGDLDGARDEVTAYPLDSTTTANVARLVHRRILHRTVTVGLLVLVALLGVAVVRVRALRRPLAAVSHDPSHA